MQPQPLAAIELIHKQPVRWTHDRVVSCDGGGGPLGHPKIFINVDKPKINWCTYCGLPFVSVDPLAIRGSRWAIRANGGGVQAHEHHRKLLESQPKTSYPLVPQGEHTEVGESQRVTDEALGQR
jgi:NADH dehydrogenase (ubiquinone) Fe-S protein 6